MVGHLLVLLAVLVCLRLGLWQWHRTHEATGTIQNLGYAVLWPVFAGTFIFMWVRFLRLETIKDQEEAAAPLPEEIEEDAPPPPPRSNTPSQAVLLSEVTIPDEDEDDPEMAAYNRALAAIAERDRRRAR